jgi:hypothetical protein
MTGDGQLQQYMLRLRNKVCNSSPGIDQRSFKVCMYTLAIFIHEITILEANATRTQSIQRQKHTWSIWQQPNHLRKTHNAVVLYIPPLLDKPIGIIPNEHRQTFVYRGRSVY